MMCIVYALAAEQPIFNRSPKWLVHRQHNVMHITILPFIFFVRSRMCVIDGPCTSEAFLVTFRGMNRFCALKTVNSPPPTSLPHSVIRFLFSFPQKSKMISSAVHQGVWLMTLDKRTTVSTFDQHGNHFISARYAQI